MAAALRAAEIALLLAAAWPVLRVAADRRLRRLFPWAHAAALGLVALWLALVALVVLRFPSALHALAAATALALAGTFVRSRAGLRLERALPPGSLSFSRSIRSVADRRAHLRDAERFGPIFKVAQFHRPVICVVGLERIHRLLREHAPSLAPNRLPLTRDVAGGFLRYMDDETYALYGPLFRRALSQSVVAAAGPSTQDAARRELDRLASDCSNATTPPPPAEYLDRIAVDGLVRALVGLLPGTAPQRSFVTSYRTLAEQELATSLSARTRESLGPLRRVAAERADGETASALSELRRIDPAMPDTICIDNVLFTLRFASANVVSLLHWLLAMLGRHPEWGARIRDEPELAGAFVQETLRLAQSEYLYRVVTDELEFEGYRFPRGWLVRLCIWESHRSPDAFEQPERFDPDRFVAKPLRTSEYSPFGWGQHACNGVALTSMICTTVLETLVTGYRWTVSGDGPAERDFRHWHHWRPSSALRLRVTSL